MSIHLNVSGPRLAILGLGNMGVSVAAAALKRGFGVVAMDIDPDKVQMTADGQCVVPEPGITEVFTAARRDNRLAATTDLAATIAATDTGFIAVPTPPDDQGDIDYRILVRLLREMREPISRRDARYDIVLGSTVFPGTTRCLLLPELKPLRLGQHYQFAVSPVFLRAGNGMEDYLDPGRIVVGIEGPAREGVRHYFTGLFPGRDDAWYVDYDTAECVKAIHNAWMSMKVVFANETGQWCKSVGVDGRTVMDIVLSDRQRLLSRSHLNPGPPYSGPCLPKDALALRRHLAQQHTNCPLFVAIQQSNVDYKQQLFNPLLETATPEPVGVLGVAFKPDFNELRWSIATELIEMAQQRGRRVAAYDRAFTGVARESFELACRGSAHLHKLFNIVRQPLEETWRQSRRIFLNMVLNERELKAIKDIQRETNTPRVVVDVYGGPLNEALAALPQLTYHGAAWAGAQAGAEVEALAAG
jgi:nucleotide sugar dehydrogenase